MSEKSSSNLFYTARNRCRQREKFSFCPAARELLGPRSAGTRRRPGARARRADSAWAGLEELGWRAGAGQELGRNWAEELRLDGQRRRQAEALASAQTEVPHTAQALGEQALGD